MSDSNSKNNNPQGFEKFMTGYEGHVYEWRESFYKLWQVTDKIF